MNTVLRTACLGENTSFVHFQQWSEREFNESTENGGVTMETDTSLLRAELEEEELYNLLQFQTVGKTPIDTMPSKVIRPQPV
ncbi:hypothetical protein PHYPO_G00039700 [Pangasianodon hypophthalmus]|uniref:Uncharacterized protein n=1 Tax=Pangasianodon hypophthalmus TaxID=310915 RepID=A0A5N5MET4_PANHP|nr:hypothetical protein PHYPO_G00039700 [Pangasianodon hypophthalmus]